MRKVWISRPDSNKPKSLNSTANRSTTGVNLSSPWTLKRDVMQTSQWAWQAKEPLLLKRLSAELRLDVQPFTGNGEVSM